MGPHPVRWGVLGCARVFERRMVPAFRDAPNAELVAVASRDLTKASDVASRHGIPKAYGSYEALLADDSIDAVYVPLPNDIHVEWTLAALSAGKHVLCDKPLSLDVQGALRCAESAAQTCKWRQVCGADLALSANHRSSPAAVTKSAAQPYRCRQLIGPALQWS
ncbi:MAG: Gfo/Idh/MocA family protein, partial [Armatimonadaceae bacterium]